MRLLCRFTIFERCLWAGSVSAVLIAFFLSPDGDPLSLAASLIGVTSLIFLARGYAAGQVLMLLFATLYGILSWQCRYYGEMLTYVGMTAPMALLSLIEWLRHPYKDSGEVAVAPLSGRKVLLLLAVSLPVTLLFYFLLKWLGTADLLISTLSVTTSFIAAGLTLLRSPFYALAYAGNDVVLLVLWGFASVKDPSHFPTLICFGAFLVNDLYGFISWRRMQRRQHA